MTTSREFTTKRRESPAIIVTRGSTAKENSIFTPKPNIQISNHFQLLFKICNDSFHCANQMKNHEASIHDKERFPCKTCMHVFVSNDRLKAHVAKYHGK